MEPDHDQPFTPGKDWNPARPEVTPAPGIWHAALALGSTLLVWGLISSLILTAAGLIVFAAALTGWIGELRHERNRK